MWYFSLTRFLIGAASLLIASVMDLKTRRVPNRLWIVMGSIAMAVLFSELLVRKLWFDADIYWQHFLIFVPIIVLFSEAFLERAQLYSEKGLDLKVLTWLLLPVFVFIYMVNTLTHSLLFWTLAMIPGMMSFAFLLYFFYILYGGADAKAVITLAILVPFYPHVPNLTQRALSAGHVPLMQTLFPFTLVILLNSSLIVVVFPIFYFLMNVLRRDVDVPKMFFGYRKKIADIEDSFVWPMEYYEDGNLKTELFPRSDPEEKLESLKRHDRKRVWTTPKIPFIVPIFVGFILSFIIGNPLMHVL
ncbi:MAG: A24 family peptidase C-terminal domain-containing protein [Candidatus Thermoplasmatota archaeon]